MDRPLPLSGRHIVVTRPAGQAVHLAEALVAQGAKPVLFPVLAIKPLTDTTALMEQVMRLDNFDLAIFISPNAAQMGLQHVLAHRSWPPHLRVATVGHSSEEVLSTYDLAGQEQQVICPQDRYDSEALLEMPALQDVAKKHVIIFRGDGGRDLLAETLRKRGATVEYASCYRRQQPDIDPAPLMHLWEAGTLDAVVVTSSEGLHNLHTMVGLLGQAWLRKSPVFVPHERIARVAREHGITNVQLTAPADNGLVAGLLAYFNP